MKKQWSLAILPVLALLALPASADDMEDSEEAAILAVVQQAFDALGPMDGDVWRQIQYAEGTTLSVRPDAESGEWVMNMRSNEAGLAGFDGVDRGYYEGWTAEPTVMIRGAIAVVWGEYDFWINDTFSHCGVDSIDLVKLDGTWKIANFMWTAETENCPTDPNRD